MKNYYSILGIASDATQEEINKAYRQKMSQSDIGSCDYEQMRDALEAKKAYAVLSDKANRILYDIKQEIPTEERILVSTQEEINSVIETLENSITRQKTQISSQLTAIQALKKENKSLKKELETSNKNLLSNEQNINALKESNVHTHEKLNQLKIAFEDLKQSKESDADQYFNQINKLKNQIEILSNHNLKYKNILKKSGMLLFKIIAAVVVVMIFVFILISINQ